MSRERKSQVDDITKLRRILDNSSDPSLSYLVSKDDKVLESVRRRLSGGFVDTQPQAYRFSRSSESMEPRVSIRTNTIISPRFMTPPPTIEPLQPLPEFDLVSPAMPTKTSSPADSAFSDVELFEVEKLDRGVPEFLEVTPLETAEEPREMDSNLQEQEAALRETNLPEWEPVEEEQGVESEEQHQNKIGEDVPEFERVDLSVSPEEQRPNEWQTSLQKEEQIEAPVVFTPAEPPEPSGQKLSKRQQRAAKKAQRKKERDAKKRKKSEQKRLKKEKREEHRGAKRTDETQHLVLQPADEPSSQVEFIDARETPPIRVDYNNFKGIECIDKKTAEILYKNGYFSVENLSDATIDDLVEIRGIKRTLAKQIKKEIEQQITEPTVSEFIPATHKRIRKKEKKKLTDSAEWESSSSKSTIQKASSHEICTYKDFTLYQRETRKQNGKKTTIHYFAKDKPENGYPTSLPDGYRIAVNKKTKVPFLKKKR